MWMTVASIAVVLLFVFSVFSEYYTHPMPEADCSQPYDYPICERKYEPAVPAPPNLLGYTGGILLALLIAGVFTWTSWNASILRKDWYIYKDIEKPKDSKDKK